MSSSSSSSSSCSSCSSSSSSSSCSSSSEQQEHEQEGISMMGGGHDNPKKEGGGSRGKEQYLKYGLAALNQVANQGGGGGGGGKPNKYGAMAASAAAALGGGGSHHQQGQPPPYQQPQGGGAPYYGGGGTSGGGYPHQQQQPPPLQQQQQQQKYGGGGVGYNMHHQQPYNPSSTTAASATLASGIAAASSAGGHHQQQSSSYGVPSYNPPSSMMPTTTVAGAGYNIGGGVVGGPQQYQPQPPMPVAVPVVSNASVVPNSMYNPHQQHASPPMMGGPPTNTMYQQRQGIPLQLSIRCAKLHNVEAGTGTSDPYAVVSLLNSQPSQQGGQSSSSVIGQTEIIRNTLSPDFVTIIPLPSGFVLGQPLFVNVAVYDDNRQKKMDKPMGSAVFELGEVLGKPGGVLGKRLRKGGTIYLQVEKGSGSTTSNGVAIGGGGNSNTIPQQKLTLQLRANGLKNKDTFGKSDPFFELSRGVLNATGGSKDRWNNVFRSKHVNNNLNPVWDAITIGLDVLCNDDMSRPIRIDVYDYSKKGKHEFIGSVETTTQSLVSSAVSGGVSGPPASSSLQLTNGRGKTTGRLYVMRATFSSAAVGSTANTHPVASSFTSYQMSGHPHQQQQQPYNLAQKMGSLSMSCPPGMMMGGQQGTHHPQQQPYRNPSMMSRPTFVDYLGGGCEMRLCVAIDFTGSNGDPRIPGTLHHVSNNPNQHHPSSLNPYEKAITAIGTVLAKYDSDQMFRVWGFGAKYGGIVRHCFQVGSTPEVHGVDGIVNAYRGVFRTGLVLSGPTVFTEVMETAASEAIRAQEQAQANGKQVYTVLLIVTDGAVSDVAATKRTMASIAHAPLSVVIVGVGNADFSAMRFLDGDNEHNAATRDIAQFVEFNQHQHDRNSLTASTLAEIPDQMVEYYQARGIQPGTKQVVSEPEISVMDYTQEDEIDLSSPSSSSGGCGGYYNPHESSGGHSFTPQPPTAPPAPPSPSSSNPYPEAYNPSYNPANTGGARW